MFMMLGARWRMKTGVETPATLASATVALPQGCASPPDDSRVPRPIRQDDHEHHHAFAGRYSREQHGERQEGTDICTSMSLEMIESAQPPK